ncbi:MAG: DUF5107 domain-containing protein [Verrucomicrobiaceae bacterium]|nr:MAG: DUF5107 domain-containing protein [Verrucomicrobiaceae bacterium]
MTSLTITDQLIPAADLGPQNPLPQLSRSTGESKPLTVYESVPVESRKYLGYGVSADVADPALPYLVQDGYTRDRQVRPFKTAILENDYLKATILLERGGRLWSLLDKRSGRDLVTVNPVFQPANLAIRNAWFSGGVEWNCGVRGHTPLGCDPLFAAELTHPEGWPVLRLWEFERIRAVTYRLDFLLPPDSPWLMVRVAISNPHAHELPMYWWSNIAVPVSPDVRVLAPAARALNNAYNDGLRCIPIPLHDGVDVTYGSRSRTSNDYFFMVPETSRPWVTALDADGSGLIQTSTRAQRGRKLFVWGESTGGNQWQKFLTEGDAKYLEIQAGVSPTQYESFPMAAFSEIEWLEAYGLMEADSQTVHGCDWQAATGAVAAELERRLPAADLEKMLASNREFFSKAPERIIQNGSGWGALERLRRERQGEPPLVRGSGIVFDEETLSEEQSPWISLLDKGSFPEVDEPVSWMIQDEWVLMLEKSADVSWLASLHLGVIRYHRGDLSGAQEAWQESLQQRLHYITLRNLALLATREGRSSEAARLYLEARALNPDLAPLAFECLQSLIADGHDARALDLFEEIPPAIAALGRSRLIMSRAAVRAGRLSLAEELLKNLEVADIQEGEVSLSDLWYELKAKQIARDENSEVTDEIHRKSLLLPVPPHLDFRQAPRNNASLSTP